MHLFITILILLMVWFFLIAPFIKLINISRNWKNTFTEAQKQARQQYDKQQRKTAQEPKKKKIDSTVGEYVEFTETKDSDSTSTKSTKANTDSAATESQITDVSWEDLPDNSQR